jgi:hypothetical protein
MSLASWVDTCSRCQQSRFWPSRSGYLVCFTCNPDPLQALTVLARRGSIGAIKRAEGWAETPLISTSMIDRTEGSVSIKDQPCDH